MVRLEGLAIDLDNTFQCGQTFRWRRLGVGSYLGNVEGKAVRAELADAGADLRQSDHIGICTTCARLRLYYGESAAIDVQNRPRVGFLLTLRLPRKENEHEGTDC